ncbi:hypothetical protein AVEN_114257-1 [Araneus ventricosus]|uniref:Uncharacterized protein n=1 Tax=Araneus ventricosus TaxID=182803 RepID=A0A4Y2MFG7_ARAVE|nr:hypothetical protein AVEN_114257-1 [Araneus ventricosus]
MEDKQDHGDKIYGVIFAAKELEKYLETEADVTKAAEIKDAKKDYPLLLTLLDDTILATMAIESSACAWGNHVLKNTEECVIAKRSNTPISKGPRSRERMAMRMVHTDIRGPIDPPT